MSTPRRTSSSSGLLVGLLLGAVLTAGAFIGFRSGEDRRASSSEQASGTPPSTKTPAGGAPGAAAPTEPAAPRDPFAGVVLESDPALAAGPAATADPAATRAFEVLRGYATDSRWTLAVDRVARAQPALERFRTVRAATDRFDDVQPWGADAREALEAYRVAAEQGAAVEARLREERAYGYRFEGVREAVGDWERTLTELERAVAELDWE